MNKKVVFFNLMNLLITFILAMIFGGATQNIRGNELLLGSVTMVAVQLSPLITTLIFRKKYNERKFYAYKLNRYSVIAIIFPITLVLLSSFILDLMGMPYVKSEYTGYLLLIGVIVTIVGSISEEIGWRGTLLQIFENKYTSFTSSLFVGILWGTWHFFKIMNVGFVGYLLFIPTVIMLSIFITYFYKKSKNNILNAIFYHTFFNLSNMILLVKRESIQLYLTILGVSALLLILLFMYDREYFKLKESIEISGIGNRKNG